MKNQLEIWAYTITHNSQNGSEGVEITLLVKDDKKTIINVHFIRPSKNLPPNQLEPKKKLFKIYYLMNEVDTFISILRIEMPIVFKYYLRPDSNTGEAWISTSFEPVGEEETRHALRRG